MRRNLRCCPQNCRKTASIPLIRSSLEYSCIVWDPHQQEDIDKLEGIQRLAAPFITRNYRDHNYRDRTPGIVTNMLHELTLEPLYQRRQQLRLLFFFNMVRGLVLAIPAEKYIHQQIGKRKMRPRIELDFKNHKHCSEPRQEKFPVLRTRDHQDSRLQEFLLPQDYHQLEQPGRRRRNIRHYNSLP